MSIWTLEVIAPFTVHQRGQVVTWRRGQRLHLPSEKGRRVLERVGDKVLVVEQEGIDHAIGTAVEASLDFLNGAGEPIPGVGPWVVTDLVDVSEEPGLLAGRWLFLMHGLQRRWTHESKTAPYRCPNCKRSRCWWTDHTVLCAPCVPPSCPPWEAAWRELAEHTSGLSGDDPRSPTVIQTLYACDEAFRQGNYAVFQTGAVRVRRAMQGATEIKRKGTGNGPFKSND